MELMDTCIILQVGLYSLEGHESICCMIRSYFRQVTLSVYFLLLLMESRLRIKGRELRIKYSFLRKVAGVPTKFRYKELEEATNGFQAVIVKVSSASVFKGILSDDIVVAAKRSDEEMGDEERGEREFRLEVAAIVGVQHVNHFQCHRRLIFTQIVKAYCTWLVEVFICFMYVIVLVISRYMFSWIIF